MTSLTGMVYMSLLVLGSWQLCKRNDIIHVDVVSRSRLMSAVQHRDITYTFMYVLMSVCLSSFYIHCFY